MQQSITGIGKAKSFDSFDEFLYLRCAPHFVGRRFVPPHQRLLVCFLRQPEGYEPASEDAITLSIEICRPRVTLASQRGNSNSG
jgi:hypothetical protein